MNFINHRSYNVKEFLFLVGFIIFLSKIAFGNTTILNIFDVNSELSIFFYITGSLLIAIKILFFDKYSVLQLLVLFFVSIIFLYSFRENKNSEILITLFLILGSKSVSMDKIVKAHFVTYGFIMMLALLFSITNVTENYIVYSSSIVRYSLGNTYPTDFSAGIFFLTLDYIYINKNNISYVKLLLLLIIAGITYFFSKGTTSFILSIIFLMYTLMNFKLGFHLFNNKSKLRKLLVVLSYPIMAGISILIPFVSNTSTIWLYIDRLLSYRISYSRQALEKYGLSLFGKSIKFIGGGWNTYNYQEYFYVDNGYLYIGLSYGVLILAMICFGFSVVLLKENKNKLLVSILVIISINGLIEPRFFNYLYNPFLFSIPTYALIKKKDYYLIAKEEYK